MGFDESDAIIVRIVLRLALLGLVAIGVLVAWGVWSLIEWVFE